MGALPRLYLARPSIRTIPDPASARHFFTTFLATLQAGLYSYGRRATSVPDLLSADPMELLLEHEVGTLICQLGPADGLLLCDMWYAKARENEPGLQHFVIDLETTTAGVIAAADAISNGARQFDGPQGLARIVLRRHLYDLAAARGVPEDRFPSELSPTPPERRRLPYWK